MKELAHFAVGVATASFFPLAVEAGQQGNPLYFLLGGMCGLLPDTLERTFERVTGRHDVEITPDPLHPDPAMIAEAIAEIVRRADDRQRPLVFRLNACRIGPDRWHRYRVRFNVAKQEIEVGYGPYVDGSGEAETVRAARPKAARPLDCAVKLHSWATTVVDVKDAPLLIVAPCARGGVDIGRRTGRQGWPHSLCLAALAGLLATAAWGLTAGWIAACAWLTHSVTDLLGHGAAPLFFPLTQARVRGLHWVDARRAFPAAVLAWAACLLVYANLSRAPAVFPVASPPMQPLFFGLVLPLSLDGLLRRKKGFPHE